MVDRVNRLEAGTKAGRAGEIAGTLTRLDLLGLDELGDLPFARSGGQRLFHRISRLYKRISVVITSNLALAGRRHLATWLVRRLGFDRTSPSADPALAPIGTGANA